STSDSSEGGRWIGTGIRGNFSGGSTTCATLWKRRWGTPGGSRTTTGEGCSKPILGAPCARQTSRWPSWHLRVREVRGAVGRRMSHAISARLRPIGKEEGQLEHRHGTTME